MVDQQPLKLRNPTQYHLLASQQHKQEDFLDMEDPSLDYGDGFQTNFLSPMSSNSLQEFDDFEGGNKKRAPGFGVSTGNRGDLFTEESPSDYSLTSVDDPWTHNFVGPMDIHRSNNSNNHHHHVGSGNHSALGSQLKQPMFMPSSSFDSASFFPMSAPANIGFDQHFGGSSPTTTMHPGLASLHHRQPTSFDSVTPTSVAAVGSGSFEDDYAMQMNLQVMMEKRRRRRESHNAVERRRRENINERIQELGSLLPDSMLEDLQTSANMTNGNNNNKPNKGAILRKSVDYIRLMQQDLSGYQQRLHELEKLVEQYRKKERTP
ncbi:helix-loop-helix DNA-binding domain-containing protein [Radiomyces spectabilis]|uniref:helix-loop-helix DNA-binding domain-containing protein n=1 Tax=Radiomyces spectabilis TaxID=64574 RepID=UPI00221E97EA|nr:helix-loop-helix DNA-binding domain-containing protein [Radiomyces spectabilis]KAI8391601.1 helix-loop-helix DNA-binding domain-containing protein [Radiomyces spectabilis]